MLHRPPHHPLRKLRDGRDRSSACSWNGTPRPARNGPFCSSISTSSSCSRVLKREMHHRRRETGLAGNLAERRIDDAFAREQLERRVGQTFALLCSARRARRPARPCAAISCGAAAGAAVAAFAAAPRTAPPATPTPRVALLRTTAAPALLAPAFPPLIFLPTDEVTIALVLRGRASARAVGLHRRQNMSE